MRKKITVANWKMNLNFAKAMALVDVVIDGLADSLNCEVVFAPPYVYLHEVLTHIQRHSDISLAAQDCSEFSHGAYTGEVSASMLSSIGVDYVLIGHSERRRHFKEPDEVLAAKVDRAIENFMIPVFCCGETSEQRNSGSHLEVVKAQLQKGLFHLSAQQFGECVIAYEPVWAIGTGVNATAAQAQEMHASIRSMVSNAYGKDLAESISILYGGSISTANAKELFSSKDVDGGLVGGASLKAADFLEIVGILSNLSAKNG